MYQSNWGKNLRNAKWRPEQESNLCLSLRRAALYPLNYRGARKPVIKA